MSLRRVRRRDGTYAWVARWWEGGRDLRHTCATLRVYEGRTLNEVAEHLSHADPNFTARVYTHVLRDAEAAPRTDRGHDHQGQTIATGSTITDEEVLELARTAGEWLFDRRERLEKRDREGIAFPWLHVERDRKHPPGFDVLEVAGSLTLEERVLQEDLIDLVSGGNAPVIETP